MQAKAYKQQMLFICFCFFVNWRGQGEY